MRESFFEKMYIAFLFKSTSTESVNGFRESAHVRNKGWCFYNRGMNPQSSTQMSETSGYFYDWVFLFGIYLIGFGDHLRPAEGGEHNFLKLSCVFK